MFIYSLNLEKKQTQASCVLCSYFCYEIQCPLYFPQAYDVNFLLVKNKSVKFFLCCTALFLLRKLQHNVAQHSFQWNSDNSFNKMHYTTLHT